MKLRNLRSLALFVGLMAGTSVMACSSAEEETEEDEGALELVSKDVIRELMFTGKWTNWSERNPEKIQYKSSKATAANKIIVPLVLRLADGAQRELRGPAIFGLLKLSAIRDWLLEENLIDTEPTKGRVQKFNERKQEEQVTCDEASKTARRIDGTCNDLTNPAMGAANVRFGRNVPLANTFPKDILSPSPREVSLKLLSRPVGTNGQRVVQEVPFLNLLALSWIQYMNHDWFSHGEVERQGVADAELIQIPLAENDPFRQKGGQPIMFVRKTETRAPDTAGRAPTYYNENTHWWDGSQLYGSTKAVADSLRVNEGGTLKAELDLRSHANPNERDLYNGYLPVGADGVEMSGFVRNWWVGLDILHTMFAREHNAIVKELRSKEAASVTSEQDLYDKARMINAAVMAKIHTIEWTPAILPNPGLNVGMHSNWYGLKTAVWGALKSEFFGPEMEGRPTNLTAVSVFDQLAKTFGLESAVVNGLVGGRRNLAGAPFSLTEEFTSVYRLHSLLPENINLRTGAGVQAIPTTETRKEKSAPLARQHGLQNWMITFGHQKPGQLVLNNFPAFLQDLDVPGFDKYDIGAVDILRDRERGVPRYNEFRKLLQLKPLDSIEELCTDRNGKLNEAHAKAIKEVYGGDINKVDLLVGTLAEATRPEMFGFGETQFQIFILMASRRLMADRFYADDFNAKTYTATGIEWVKQANMKNVVLRNYPELKGQLDRVDNAFFPWDGSATIDGRTPLGGGRAVPAKYPK